MQIYQADIENRFAFHAATPANGRGEVHADIRDQCKALARFMVANVPEGREQALAVTKIEEAMMWANAGIARQS